jgi:high affinity Mn2+ porin
MKTSHHCLFLLAFFTGFLGCQRARAADSADPPAVPVATPQDPEAWNLHAQMTAVSQFHPAFHSPYEGSNSLSPGFSEKETSDVTVFVGRRLWAGAAAYLDPEVDQGFGLDNTLGIAGFPSGEAYKVGSRNPYFRLPRAFVRQVVAKQDARASTFQADGPNQIAESVPDENVTITVGKFGVGDIFDTNTYAHDPRADFLNWSVIDGGAFDYAADAWGFTYGGAVEWTRAWWTLRGGAFALSKVPNSKDLEGRFRQFSLIAEFEERHHFLGHDGKAKALAFVNRGRMGRYDDAVRTGLETSSIPDTALVRRYASRPGIATNIEQEIDADWGIFARASINDGAQEAFEFTEINKSLAAGASLKGQAWGRQQDSVGVAAVVNGLSSAARSYFAAGGIGILIGDGRLPDYGFEKILETYYCLRPAEHVAITGDFQFVHDPAYNRDRGPVSIFGLRIHAEF